MKNLSGQASRIMWGYNVFLTAVSCVLLVVFVVRAPYAPPPTLQEQSNEAPQVTLESTEEPDPEGSSALAETEEARSELSASDPQDSPSELASDEPTQSPSPDENGSPENIPDLTAWTALTMAVAGFLGGVLCNLRGLFNYHVEEGGLPKNLSQPYYLRPWMGAATGLVTLFIGHLLVSALADAAEMSWLTFSGRLPYIALALLAGFACREFTERMKAVAMTLFSISQTDPDEKLRKLQQELQRLKEMADTGLIEPQEHSRMRQDMMRPFIGTEDTAAKSE